MARPKHPHGASRKDKEQVRRQQPAAQEHSIGCCSHLGRLLRHESPWGFVSGKLVKRPAAVPVLTASKLIKGSKGLSGHSRIGHPLSVAKVRGQSLAKLLAGSPRGSTASSASKVAKPGPGSVGPPVSKIDGGAFYNHSISKTQLDQGLSPPTC